MRESDRTNGGRGGPLTIYAYTSLVTYLRQGVLHHIARVSHDSRWKLAPTTITQRPRSPPLLRGPPSRPIYLLTFLSHSGFLLLRFRRVTPSRCTDARAPSPSFSRLPERTQDPRGISGYARTRRHDDKCSRPFTPAAAAAAASRRNSVTSRATHFLHRQRAGGRSRAYAAAWVACRYCTAFDGSIVSRRVVLLGPFAPLRLLPRRRPRQRQRQRRRRRRGSPKYGWPRGYAPLANSTRHGATRDARAHVALGASPP